MMSRHVFNFPDGRFVIAGYDRPMRTWYAQLWHEGDDPHRDTPHAVVGYHPAEVDLTLADRSKAKIGPYPVPAADGLVAYVRQEWDLSLDPARLT